ncbi:type I secretion system permease/ATPase [Azospirillum sp.]|uniref:type I secretion system permease/ATPase n=1 Tax=Azospirillum sp. TaxID=34012 RepID=UPI003D71B7AE
MRTAPSELWRSLGSCRGALLAAGLLSLFVNLLQLASPLYMMQVYDRVLNSRSEGTLAMLTLIALGMMLVSALLELCRARVLVRTGAILDETLNVRLFDALFERQLRAPGGSRTQPLQDLTTLRQFMTGSGLFAFFDAPWAPVFMAVLFLFHPLLGGIALGGGGLLFLLALASEAAARAPLRQANAEATASLHAADAALRHVEVVEAMGMLPGLRRRWQRRHRGMLGYQAQASDRSALLAAASRFTRVALQTSLLGAGAYLAIAGAITPGMMIGASILGGKALAPVDTAVAGWNGLVGARMAWRRLAELLEAAPPAPARMALPAPAGRVAFEGVAAAPPGAAVPTVRALSFTIAAGEAVGIVGPSAAGKSTLARLLVGVWHPRAGTVRLDGADLAAWPRAALGPHIGYLPQDVALLDGTVAETIARFGDVDPGAVVAAARRAGVHDMILRLPQGYDTPVGDGGMALSGGQRQRLGLARALYGDPALLVLDEPNANLDEEGEAALLAAIVAQKDAGRTLVVIAHRPSLLSAVDTVMVMRDGMVALHGPRAEVLAKVTRPIAAARPPLAAACPA